MTTRREILSKAYPDHIKLIERNRIAQEANGADLKPKNWLDGLCDDPDELVPGMLLAMAFHWSKTPEGHEFWAKLSHGSH